MYQYTPDEIDKKRAHHQAVKQGATDVAVKRIGNLGELAFEQFCREYLPTEMWEWENEEAIRRCNAESFSGHDFEVFGYKVDVKTSRDVSAFLPKNLVENDSEDDLIVMVWHRDNEDGLILLGWEHVDTLKSKVRTQEAYSGEEPEKLKHLAARPMNDLSDLGPNTAYMNQKPVNPFSPGDRVVKKEDEDASVAVVVEVLPPESQVELYGKELDGEGVRVAFPSSLDEGPGEWREIHPALLSSYCDDQDIKLYTYKHSNLEFASNKFVIGDRVINTSHAEPDEAVVVEREMDGPDTVSVVFRNQLDEGVSNGTLLDFCEAQELSRYSYSTTDLEFSDQ